MYDIIIKNGTIIDGTGGDSYIADVGVKGMRIVCIGNLQDAEAEHIIDAKCKLVTPGFIDMHSHADTVILGFSKMESMLRQGITTFVGCQCSHSIAPVGHLWEGTQALYDILQKLCGKLNPDWYDMDHYTRTDETIPYIEAECGFTPTWKTMGDFLDEIDRHGLSGNIITLAGYNTLRLNNSDPDHIRALTEDERQTLKTHIRECLESGAFGMSTGLDYKPGYFCTTAELIDMASELKPYDGIYFSHWRKTGLRNGTPKKQKKIDGIREVMEIGIVNDIQVEISHLSTGFDIFPSNDDFMQTASAQRTLQVIDEYVARGARANFDVIPNITGGTMIAPALMAIFRPWYMYTNGATLFSHNLRYPDYRKNISDVILAGKYYALNPVINPDWDESMKVIQSRDPSRRGCTIRELAAKAHKPSLEIVFDLLAEEPDICIFQATHSMNQYAVKTYLEHPLACVGNDTFVFDLESTRHYDPEFPNKKPNPNTYCGFIKFIQEFGMPRIEDTIRKVTGKPADILGLTDRGLIKEGYRADMLVLDIANMRTNENLIEPRVYPEGVQYVAVNGVLVIDDGVHTGKLPGGSIRRYNK